MKRHSISPPIPLDAVCKVADELSNQGWEVLNVIPIGTAQASKIIQSGPQQPIIMVLLFCCKEFKKGEKVEYPKINL